MAGDGPVTQAHEPGQGEKRVQSDGATDDTGDGVAHYRTLTATLVDGVAIIDEAGTLRAFNAAAERMFGYAERELLGRNVSVLMPEPDRSRHDGYLRRYLVTGERRIIGIGRTVTGLRRDGTTFPMELSVGETAGTGTRRFVGVLRDLTERQRREAARSDETARAEALLRTAPDAVLVIDEDGIVQSCNDAAVAVFGYPASAVVGRNVRMLMPEPYRGGHDGYLRRYLAGGEARVIGIGRIVTGQRRDGTTFPMELSVGEVRLENGRRLFTGFVRDITARRVAERRLGELQAELLQVARLTTMGEMGAALAHELNQPLAAIVNYLQAGRRLLETGGEHLPRLDGALQRALEQALRAGDIVRNLRRFAERGTTERRLEDLNRVAEEAAALALTGAGELGIRAHLDLARQPVRAVVDRLQMQQVVVNLIRNAMEAMSEAASPRPELTIATGMADDGVRLSVADRGPGLAPAVRERLFRPFTTTKRQGMGLGLSICRAVVSAHGGRLEVADRPDGGTVFTVVLPAAEDGDGG